MERPTDSYKETHNIVLANEDTLFGGQVSNLQVIAMLRSFALHNLLGLSCYFFQYNQLQEILLRMHFSYICGFNISMHTFLPATSIASVNIQLYIVVSWFILVTENATNVLFFLWVLSGLDLLHFYHYKLEKYFFENDSNWCTSLMAWQYKGDPLIWKVENMTCIDYICI